MPEDALPPRRTGRAGFPHPALPDTFAAGVRKELHATSYVHQPQASKVSIPGLPFRQAVGPLAPSLRMSEQPTTHVRIDLPERLAGVTQTEVVRPAPDLPVNVGNQVRQRLPADTIANHVAKLRSFPIPRLRRRAPVQVPPLAA